MEALHLSAHYPSAAPLCYLCFDLERVCILILILMFLCPTLLDYFEFHPIFKKQRGFHHQNYSK